MYGQFRNALIRRHDPNTTRSHVPNKALTRTTGDEYISAIKWMSRSMVVAMNCHIGIKIKSLNLPRRFLTIGFKYDEATCPSGMSGNGTKILAANGYSHRYLG